MKLYLSPITLLYFAFCLLVSHEMTVVAIFCAVLVHELTHLILLRVEGGKVTSLSITPMGLSIGRVGLLSHWREILLSLSAPLVNLLLALLYTFLDLNSCSIEANLGLGLLNLLPICPLDGGMALSSFLSIYFDGAKTQRIMSFLSMIGLLLFWVLSVAIALVANGNLSMLLLSSGLFLSTADFGNSYK